MEQVQSIFSPPTNGAIARQANSGQRDAEQIAEDFEAAFIGEMLRHSGFEKAIIGESGGAAGAMATFLVDSIANDMARAGGFGIGAMLADQLKERSDARSR